MTKVRSLIYLVVYLGALVLLRLVVGTAFPNLAADADNLWFASGLLLVILGVFVTEKYFTKSLDVVVNTITLVVVLNTIDQPAQFTLYQPFYFFTITIGLMAIASFMLSDEDADPASIKQRLAKSMYRISSFLGGAKFLFSIIFILSLFNYFIYSLQSSAIINNQQITVLMMIVFWGAVLLIEPIDRNCIEPLVALWRKQQESRRIGRVVRRISPNIIIAEKAKGLETPTYGALALISGGAQDENGLVAMYLDDLETEDGRYLQFYVIGGQANKVVPGTLLTTLTETQVDGFLQETLAENSLYQRRERIIGTVASRSDIDVIQIKMLSGADRKMTLAEGDLLSVELYGKQIKYQIIGVSTDTENVDTQNKKGAKYISAQQIGEWDETGQKFVNASWVPDYNTLVFQESAEVTPVPERGPNFYRVGIVPKSQYPVYINFAETISHHLAIIGKTGTGKSKMAAKIVESLVAAGYKIVILEVDSTHQQSLSKRIDQSLISTSSTTWSSTQELRRNGYKTEQETVWHCAIDLNPTDERRVFIINLDNQSADLEGGPLSHSESARAVIQEILKYKINPANSDQKICVVMEEAYDFIPESNFGQQSHGQPSVSRIAQLILKCRKHNVGFLVITQRTALVSKTILYQCNTIIALQTFDETSKNFMSAYINNKYLESMSILPRFRAIVVGKGSSCDKPVIVDFEDRALEVQPQVPIDENLPF